MSDLGSADVVVIGGGVVGTAIAHALAKRRLGRVALIERGAIASGTTGAGMGNLVQGSHPPGVLADLTRTSVRLYAELDEPTRRAMAHQVRGSLQIVVEPDHLAIATALVGQLRATGLAIEILDAGATRAAVPGLGPAVVGSIFCPDDARVSPSGAARAFATSAVALGVDLHEQTPVVAIEQTGGRIVAVKTAHGRLLTGTVVLAAGVWTPALAAGLGLDLPIRPVRGVALATAGEEEWHERPALLEFGGPTGFGAPNEPAIGTVLYPRASDGALIIGTSREPSGFEPAVGLALVERLIARATMFVPSLARRHLIESWAGLRPATPDAAPLVGRVPGLNLIVAAGHFGEGTTLAPATGELVADLLEERADPRVEAALGFARFGTSGFTKEETG